MTKISIFTHDVMKDFKYLKEEEHEIVNEALMRPLLEDEAMFLYAVNQYFEFKYFQITFDKYKKELASMVILHPDLFWRIIQTFEHLKLFCEDHPDHARQAIVMVLLSPANMTTLLLNAFAEAAFAGYCLVYGLTDINTYKEVAKTIIENAKQQTHSFFKPAAPRDSGKSEPNQPLCSI
jgi:hypothetical protein